MFQRILKPLSSVSPRVAIVAALITIVAVSGVALLLTRGGPNADANSLVQPYAARIDRVEGSVGLAPVKDEEGQLEWTEATVNSPISIGDRIYTRDGARASIALTGHDYVRLNSGTSLDVLSLEDHRTQLALRSGSALFDVGPLESDELYEVATPCGAVDFTEPGLYQVGMDGNNAIISVLSGLAQVVGREGSGYISKGQVFTLVGAAAAEALASRLTPDLAGSIVDGYYRDRYPNTYDGRYQSYDAYLDDPDYYDPYRSSLSARYISADIPGIYDLDSYGEWVDINEHGRCWSPSVSAGWAPFRSGYWDLDSLWGPSWVSSEPWGWAPYHYGRWTTVNQRWFWVPGELRSRHDYCPAAVAFIPVADQIAWIPLGPSEVYVPRYYDESFRPRYLASEEVINVVSVQRTFVNFNAPGAVTVVPIRTFSRFIDPGVVATGDPRVFANTRSVLDPYSVEGVRELAISRNDGRRKIKLARLEAFNVPVITSTTPEVSRMRQDIGRASRVEPLGEKRKKNKLRINETSDVASSTRPNGSPQPVAHSQERDQRMATLAARAEQGDKSARREMRQLMRQEQASQQQQATQQQEQTRQQMKEQRRAERQQQTAQQGQQEQLHQQMKQQRRAERQQQQQAAAAAGQQSAQQAQLKQQRRAERQQQAAAAQQQPVQQQQIKQQRRAERQQRQAAASAQQKAAQQNQVKQQRRAEREQQQQQIRTQEQTRQQRKEQRRKPPEASVQQQQQLRQSQQEAARQAQITAQRQQLKAERHAQQRAMIDEQNRRAAQATQTQAREQIKAQRHAQQRAMLDEQNKRASMQAAQQQNQAREQMRAQRQAARAQAVQQSVQPQSAPPASLDKAQRKAEKAQRKRPQ
ncbi:MAG: DUF6600 domain-containing protein [Blastocatellia bacterium]